MSTDAEDLDLIAAGVPELTALGKRIELLRIERRMSKRVLAQRAGTSRQQLWRVMTGKSELTSSLCARLSEVLEVDSRWLRDAGGQGDAELRSADVRGGPRDFELREPAYDHAAVVRRGTPARDARGHSTDGNGSVASAAASLCQTLEDYISSPAGLEHTVDTMPVNDDGRALKRALLDAVEDAAVSHRIKLSASFFELRRQVVNGER